MLSPLPWCVRRAAVVAAAVAAAPQAAASAATSPPGNRTRAARVCASSSLSAVAPSSSASSAAAAAAAWCVLRACVCERERALAVSAHMRASAQRARPHSLNWSRARHSVRRSHARAHRVRFRFRHGFFGVIIARARGKLFGDIYRRRLRGPFRFDFGSGAGSGSGENSTRARTSNCRARRSRSNNACPCDRAGAFSGCPQRGDPLKSS